MIKGIPVKLYERTASGTDTFGHPIYTETPVTVEDVLVAPASTTEVLDMLNITGKKAVYNIAIPKGDTHDWQDCRVDFFELKKIFQEDGIRDGWWSVMVKTKVELNRSGVRELMKSAEMQAILLEQANQISSDAEKESYVAQTRAVVKINGDDGNNSLLKAMGRKNDRGKS